MSSRQQQQQPPPQPPPEEEEDDPYRPIPYFPDFPENNDDDDDSSSDDSSLFGSSYDDEEQKGEHNHTVSAGEVQRKPPPPAEEVQQNKKPPPDPSRTEVVATPPNKRPRKTMAEEEPATYQPMLGAVVTDATDVHSVVVTPPTRNPTPPPNQHPVRYKSVSLMPPLLIGLEPLSDVATRQRVIDMSGCVVTLVYGEQEQESPLWKPTRKRTRTGSAPPAAPAGETTLTPLDLTYCNQQTVKQYFEQALEDARRQYPYLWEYQLTDWLENNDHEFDSSIEIRFAMRDYMKRRRADAEIINVLGEDDIWMWTDDIDDSDDEDNVSSRLTLPLSNLVKMRRLLLPLTIQLVHGQLPNMACCTYSAEDTSLMDLWLQKVSQASAVSSGATAIPNIRNRLLDRLILWGIVIKKYTGGMSAAAMATMNNMPTRSFYEYYRVLDLLLSHLRRVGGTHLYKGHSLNLDRIGIPDLPLPMQGKNRARKSSPSAHANKIERGKILAKRNELWQEYQQHSMSNEPTTSDDDNDNKKKPPQPRLDDGNVIISEEDDGVSIDEFLAETHFMNKVNANIPRRFTPFTSRPRMAPLELEPSFVDELRKCLFDDKGRLNRSIAADISRSVKHHYINFTNDENCGRGDRRWQIPIELHTTDHKMPTRSRIEQLMQDRGIIKASHEKIHDLGLLVGGTEDQSLHHDIARRWTYWVPHARAGDNERVLGWEADRYGYNEAMAQQYAPSSFLIGMGKSEWVYLGVQKGEIERIDDTTCRIRMGPQHEKFKIVRENQYLVVLEVRGGCVFTGDFRHSGVRNVAEGTDDEALLNDLNSKIGDILALPLADHKQTTDEIVSMLCEFEGLDRLCRLHFSTELVKHRMIVPRNTVGYTNCRQNKSDGKLKKRKKAKVTNQGKEQPVVESEGSTKESENAEVVNQGEEQPVVENEGSTKESENAKVAIPGEEQCMVQRDGSRKECEDARIINQQKKQPVAEKQEETKALKAVKPLEMDDFRVPRKKKAASNPSTSMEGRNELPTSGNQFETDLSNKGLADILASLDAPATPSGLASTSLSPSNPLDVNGSKIGSHLNSEADGTGSVSKLQPLAPLKPFVASGNPAESDLASKTDRSSLASTTQPPQPPPPPKPIPKKDSVIRKPILSQDRKLDSQIVADPVKDGRQNPSLQQGRSKRRRIPTDRFSPDTYQVRAFRRQKGASKVGAALPQSSPNQETCQLTLFGTGGSTNAASDALDLRDTDESEHEQDDDNNNNNKPKPRLRKMRSLPTSSKGRVKGSRSKKSLSTSESVEGSGKDLANEPGLMDRSAGTLEWKPRPGCPKGSRSKMSLPMSKSVQRKSNEKSDQQNNDAVVAKVHTGTIPVESKPYCGRPKGLHTKNNLTTNKSVEAVGEDVTKESAGKDVSSGGASALTPRLGLSPGSHIKLALPKESCLASSGTVELMIINGKSVEGTREEICDKTSPDGSAEGLNTVAQSAQDDCGESLEKGCDNTSSGAVKPKASRGLSAGSQLEKSLPTSNSAPFPSKNEKDRVAALGMKQSGQNGRVNPQHAAADGELGSESVSESSSGSGSELSCGSSSGSGSELSCGSSSGSGSESSSESSKSGGEKYPDDHLDGQESSNDVEEESSGLYGRAHMITRLLRGSKGPVPASNHAKRQSGQGETIERPAPGGKLAQGTTTKGDSGRENGSGDCSAPSDDKEGPKDIQAKPSGLQRRSLRSKKGNSRQGQLSCPKKKIVSPDTRIEGPDARKRSRSLVDAKKSASKPGEDGTENKRTEVDAASAEEPAVSSSDRLDANLSSEHKARSRAKVLGLGKGEAAGRKANSPRRPRQHMLKVSEKKGTDARMESVENNADNATELEKNLSSKSDDDKLNPKGNIDGDESVTHRNCNYRRHSERLEVCQAKETADTPGKSNRALSRQSTEVNNNETTPGLSRMPEKPAQADQPTAGSPLQPKLNDKVIKRRTRSTHKMSSGNEMTQKNIGSDLNSRRRQPSRSSKHDRKTAAV